jgi:HAD superfamily hydrolase (TIGR01509 family)
MIKAIFFDFNGVVIDDEPIQLVVYQELLKSEGIVLTDEDYYGSLGMNDTVFVRAAFERAGKKLTSEKLQSLIERKVIAHREKIESELPIFPGVETFVKAASRHYSLGIVSMALRAEIEDVLERANVRALFEVIVSAEDVKTCKPDPACYVRGLTALNEKRRRESRTEVLANECLVIEDSPPGIQSARSAGMRSLGVTNTVSENTLRDAGADVVTKSLFDWNVDSVRHVFG